MAQYTRNPPLRESAVNRNPLRQFETWLRAAQGAGLVEPTAMWLGTVGRTGRPSGRMVLFKGFYKGQFTFYTNFESRKGRELAANPHVALTFWWDRLERSVRIEGRVSKLPDAVARRYFRTRPRVSQLGALASRQSRAVANRAELDARMRALAREFNGREIPMPETWGGYGVTPTRFEFWQGRRGRLHDRLLFSKTGTRWKLSRLEP